MGQIKNYGKKVATKSQKTISDEISEEGKHNKKSKQKEISAAKSPKENNTKKIVKKDKFKKLSGSKTNKIKSGSKTSKPVLANQLKEKEAKYEITVDEIFDITKSPIDAKDLTTKTKKSVTDKDKLNAKKMKPEINNNNFEKAMVKTEDNKNIVLPNNSTIQTYLDAKKFLKDHNITISTITLDCKLHTLIDLDKFAKNVVLKEDGIVYVKYGNRKDSATNRTIVIIKAKKKPSKKNFYNQVTILMKPTNNPHHNYINIKVFKNGSLQMTGCKDMEDFNNVTSKLIDILKKGKDITLKNGKKRHINFIEDSDKIGIHDVKIRMINSNFRLNYKVDRKKLARLLKKNHRITTKDKEIGYVECKYEPTGGHSCVNIKYQYDEINKPSIFVFQTGAIIITGAKNLHHIIMAYHFINKILDRYHNEIRIVDLDPNAVKAEINKYLNLKKNVQKIEI